MDKKPDYANWVPKKILLLLGGLSIAAGLLLVVAFLFQPTIIITVLRCILAVFTALSVAAFAYMLYVRKQLAYDGGGVQGKVLDNLLTHLEWDGKGKLLDIGCGSGAMAIKAARRFPAAQVVGVDYWGFSWDYAKEQCEQNAVLEGVSGRTSFQHGDAADLAFADDTFDAVVSNFVFHEVKSQPDKLELIREALRVLKPGGVFALEDIFFSKGIYGDIETLLQKLSTGVANITLVDTRECSFSPKLLKTPIILGNIALLKGKSKNKSREIMRKTIKLIQVVSQAYNTLHNIRSAFFILALILAIAALPLPDAITKVARASSNTAPHTVHAGKILIVYYSNSGSTRNMAEQIKSLTHADIVEIQPVTPYPENYKPNTVQSRQEQNASYFPPIITKIENLASYDAIFVGSPCWWGSWASPVRSFLHENNLAGKKLIPFMTHGGSGFGHALKEMKSLCPEALIQEGLALKGRNLERSQSDIMAWLQNIKILQ